MARKKALPSPQKEIVLECLNHKCPECGKKMWSDYDSQRKLRTLEGIIQLRLKVRRCHNQNCSQYKKVSRPESEGSWALPAHEFGLDVIAYIGALRCQGLEKTKQLWADIELAYKWVQDGVKILENEQQHNWESVKQEYHSLMSSMRKQPEQVGRLKESVEHFLKVTASYGNGLFHCYCVEGLPRTNNDLEQTFGSFRHHQRRCTGQKKSPVSTVVRGSCRLIAAIANKLKTFKDSDLAQVNIKQWRKVRSELKRINHSRIQQRRFRQNPDVYLESLENDLLQLILPP